ncbi:MAG TPA: twin-arginine translocation signal domain-containing protein, partial [Candidatus Kapabacteria bacterium]|nr:twin-arginine translocation signal domain-containing protein [Candidatus Kapabacteria bacterium]
MNRREFLKLGSAATVAAGSASIATAADAGEAPRLQPKLGISTYSYWHFREPKVPVQTVIEKAAALGVNGVDILHRQMDSEDRS